MTSKLHRRIQHSTRALLGLFCFGLMFLFAANESQAAKKRIAIMARPGIKISKGTANWIQQAFRMAMAKGGKIQVLRPQSVRHTLLSRTIPSFVQPETKKFYKFLKKAKVLYAIKHFPLKKRCKLVLKALRVAKTSALKVSTYHKDRSAFRDLYLYLSLAHSGLGNQAERHVNVVKYIHIAPDHSLPSGVPSRFRSFHKRIATRIKRRGRVTMTLNSKPAGAQVFHNYKLLGRTPVRITNMVMGKHLIRIVKPGYAVWEQTANLNPGKLGSRRTIKATVPLKSDPQALVVTGLPIYAKDAGINDDFIDRFQDIATKLKIKNLYVTEPHKSAKGVILKVALFKSGVRKITFKYINIGNSHSTYQRRLLVFARWLKRRILAGR